MKVVGRRAGQPLEHGRRDAREHSGQAELERDEPRPPADDRMPVGLDVAVDVDAVQQRADQRAEREAGGQVGGTGHACVHIMRPA